MRATSSRRKRSRSRSGASWRRRGLPAMPAEKNRYIVPGLERGLRLLQLFTRQRRTLGAPEISKALGVPRSTVFRLIQTLEEMGFLERAANGEYQLGAAILRVGFEYLAS